MANIQDRIAALTPQQRALLFNKLVAEQLQQPRADTIPKNAKEDVILPLAPAQQRLWFLERLNGPSPVYNIPCALRLRGDLDVTALVMSIQNIVDRHAVLRTYFVMDENFPGQVIQKSCKIDVQVQSDFQSIDEAIWAEVAQPFNLQKAPLLRVKLLKLAETEHILLFTIQHIIADGWSLSVIVNELTANYNAYTQGHNAPILPELPIQYADYVIWQIERLNNGRMVDSIDYWRKQLADLPPLLKLPTDRSRAPIQDYRGHSLRFSIDKNLTDAINKLSHELQVTPFMLLLASFKILLYRYSYQEKIVVGSSIANRKRHEVEPLIGFFVNNLVLSTEIDPSEPWRELLNRIKSITLQAYDHQEVPFDYLVEILQPERSLSYSPLFQVEFTLQNTPPRLFDMVNLQVEVMPLPSAISRFDLNVSLEEGPTGIEGICEYSQQLFDDSTIRKMTSHFVQLLKSMVSNPHQSVAQLNLLSSSERAQLLAEWDQTPKSYQLDKPTHVLFTLQAQRSPTKVAVKHQQQEATYQELEKYSNQLARWLIARGLKREDRVALLLPRSINYLITLLAVLKAGGVFVPLDPDAPFSRNRLILTHSRPWYVITQQCLSLEGYNFINIEEALAMSADYSSEPPSYPVEMHDLAYLIYTSGSTGKPKGVMVEHLGMVNHLLAKIHDLQIDSSDIVGQNAVQTFDVSVWQFLSALLVGGQVVILTGEEAWEPKPLLQSLAREKISILESVPSHTDILLDEIANSPQAYSLSHLRYYVSNAEPLPLHQWQRWASLVPNATMVNTYGITECSDDISHLHLDNAYDFSAHPYIPTQGVLPNMRLYLLDSFLNPVPEGAIGEIYIGGVGVGRGYFDDPEKTKQAFIPDPFSNEYGAKLYRTGDLGRYRPRGMIECLGRRDFQLKIRGLRVEIAEIENVLRNHAEMQAVLVTSVSQEGENHLIAYLVPNRHPAPAEADMYDFCAQNLPAYMIPACFIFLDQLPLLPNGKVDRSQLPQPSEYKLKKLKNYVMPQSDIEIKLADLWAQILGLEKVGINDNFFHIGGHSLLAVNLVRKMEEILEKKLSLQQLFETPTISGVIKNL